MAHLAFIGAGAVGGFFAAQASLAGNEVSVCVRTPFRELVVETAEGLLRTPVAVRVDPAVVEPVDWVFLATKAHHTSAARPWLEALCGPDSTVVVLQNGIEHAESLRPLVHEPVAVLSSVVYSGAERVQPGHILHRTHGHFYVQDTERARELPLLFENSSAEVRLTDDLKTKAWEKLAINVAGSGITALTVQRSPVFRRQPAVEVAHALVSELVDVARMDGAKLADDHATRTVERLEGMPVDGGTSMLYDRLDGLPLEHDAIFGAVIRAGQRHGIPTPLHSLFHALLDSVSGTPIAARLPPVSGQTG